MSKKKHEGLIAFNHKGTDIMVKPSVHNILKGLTEDSRKLKEVTGKLNIAKRAQETAENQRDEAQMKVKNLQKLLSDTNEEIRKVKLDTQLANMDPKEMFEGFASAIIEFSDCLDKSELPLDYTQPRGERE